MIPRELSITAARLFVWYPETEDDMPLDPDACLWYLRIPQSGAALLETWEEACQIVSGVYRWISSPFLETDQAGSPELTLAIAPGERRKALRCIALIRSDTGLTILTDVDVAAFQASTRGWSAPVDATAKIESQTYCPVTRGRRGAALAGLRARLGAAIAAHHLGHKTGGAR